MARLLDRVIIVDVESTCWDGAPPKGQVSEIIEIGTCLLDPRTGERERKTRILVRPSGSEVSAYCTELTGLSQAALDAEGVSFADACRAIKNDLAAPKRTWASYGDYDRRQFERQCKRERVGFPFGPTHINVKNLFALRHGLDREVGMADALKLLSLPLDGRHHSGVDDAWNIARILGVLLGPGHV